MEYLSYRFLGKLSGMGAQEFPQHGFCWSESINPDLHGPSSMLGPSRSEGEFLCTVSVSLEDTDYYVRAFAVHDSDTLYGNVISFTSAWAAENTVKDVEGNLYRTVQLGGQTWMAQNLRVTMYADKTPIPNVKDRDTWFNFSEQSKAYCYYDNERNNGYWFGALYTWE